MTADEHEEVVEKLCEMFPLIDTKQLHAFVKQLLHLCKEEHVVLLFLKLRHFFARTLDSHVDLGEISKSFISTHLTVIQSMIF